SLTSLPLIIAEELDADWAKVRIVPAPPDDKVYGNPGFGGVMYTAGSNAVRSYFQPLRVFGAQVRRVLLDNAARRWGVAVSELTTEPGMVVHAKSGRRLGYGEIAAFAEIPAKAPEIKPEQLKKPEAFRLIGKDVMRVDLPGKVNGTARYSIEAEFRCDYAYHAQMEPLNSTAAVSPAGDACEVWVGSQGQTMAVAAVAKALGIPAERVRLHNTLLGGGFGRRGHRDEEFVVDS